jgi:phospholipid/cholesterol/gamma-HCH transport system ATP-binding protein
MIEVKAVRKRFGDQTVLDGITFSIAKGTVTSIIGRSGGGKSVLLKHLVGLETPDSGEVLIGGENLSLLSGPELNRLRRRCGVLFQEGALFDYLSARENVAFPLREHTKLSAREIDDLADAKLATVGLAGHETKFPAQISGGMRKRVALARALALDPDIVFFDEPTAGLDPITKAAIYELILRTHRERVVTYVIASHDIAGVFNISDEIMVLWQGKIVARGNPAQMRDDPHPAVRQFVSGSLKGPMTDE